MFSLHEGGDSDGRSDPSREHDNHHHDHQHGDGETHDTVDNEEIEVVDEIINKERKLSGKFSGIAKILAKKMEPGFLTLLRKFISQYQVFVSAEKKYYAEEEEDDLSRTDLLFS